MSGKSRLVVLVDGTPLPDDEARAVWQAFSDHMEATHGDREAFAAQRGWANVVQEYKKGRAVLAVTTKKPP
jgi:hypothetical protein